MKGCYVYFMDKDTERYVRSRIEAVDGQRIGDDTRRVDRVAEAPADYRLPRPGGEAPS
jgi:hypothetical protein